LHYLRHIAALLLICPGFITVDAQQTQFSLSIDMGAMKSFKKEQKFWAPGQTIAAHFHLSPENGAFAFLNYYINAKFRNEGIVATAKSPATIPQQISYTNKTDMDLAHISLGWKRYIAGSFNRDTKGNLYVFAGLGLTIGRLLNTHSLTIDTADYNLPVLGGKGNFKRLTIDPGIGYEKCFGGDIYFYIEGRSFVALTDYPTPYLLINGYVPVSASIHAGIRILFD
jgi:hypothetical protein